MKTERKGSHRDEREADSGVAPGAFGGEGAGVGLEKVRSQGLPFPRGLERVL